MNRTAVEQIKERIPIDVLIGSYVKLEKAGKSYKARCPFHNEKSASFFVSPDRGGYYCFGCNAKGDIFSFVEQFEGLDFRGALKVLAEKAGVPLVFDQKADGERDRLFAVMEDATKYFEGQFDRSKEAQEYVKGRGIKDDTRTLFRIGWAPEGWQNLIDFLRAKKYPDALIEKAGLGKKTEDGKFYDRFRGRVVFPIHDSSGRVVAFSGRILKDDMPAHAGGKSAKYLNSPDTPLYDKSQVLYGLDKAKTEIRRLNYTILVEGQMDLVMSHQAGIKNTVASSGTALTDETVSETGTVSNLGLIKRLSPNAIIAFDSDAAGRKAALRAAGIALSIGMDVKIADLVGGLPAQAGKDPADLVSHDPEDWRTTLKNAKPVIEFELGNVLRDVTDSRKVGRALRERVFPFLARIESRMDRDHFVQMISDKANISADAVWDDLRAVEKTIKEETNKSASATPVDGGVSSTSRFERTKRKPLESLGGGVIEGQSRLDLVERRMFGLLALMESSFAPATQDKERLNVKKYREDIQKIAGDSYTDRMARIEPLMSDIVFEADAMFGADKSRWDIHIKELITNFELDLINEDLIHALQSLKIAEKAGDTPLVTELAKKCQVLSIRKAEVARMAKK